MNRYYEVTTFTSKYLILRRARVANFAKIIKIATLFIKATFENSKKLKELEIMY